MMNACKIKNEFLYIGATNMRYRNTVEFVVYGDMLYFHINHKSRGENSPINSNISGRKESSVYWKPTIVWYIDEVRVMNKIQTRRSIRPIKYAEPGNDLAYYTYLKMYVISTCPFCLEYEQTRTGR